MPDVPEISRRIARARLRLLQLLHDTRSGHVGSCFSCIDVLTVITGLAEKDDELLLSKGHAAAALYTAWRIAGRISEEELQTFKSSPTRLGIHPSGHHFDCIPFSTGSLGHGPALAAGMAMGKRLRDQQGRIFCVTGDGEWQEGACYEALSFAVREKLDRLTFLVDCNGFQGFGDLKKVGNCDAEALAARFTAFGAAVSMIDGHDAASLVSAVQAVRPGRVQLFVLKTVKAKGLPFYENTFRSHYDPIPDGEYPALLRKFQIQAGVL